MYQTEREVVLIEENTMLRLENNQFRTENKKLKELLAEANKLAQDENIELYRVTKENKKLKDFVTRWAGHNDSCDCLDAGSPRTDCTCGYDNARDQVLNHKSDD